MPAWDKAPPTPPPRDGGPRETQRHSNRGGSAERPDHVRRHQHSHPAPSPPTQSDAGVTQFASPTQGSSPAGARLRDLRRHAGLSASALAKTLSMRPTTYKSLEDRSKKPHIEVTLAERIAPILAGRGHPPITQNDVLALAGVVAPTHNPPYIAPLPYNARVENHGGSVAIVSQDVPVVPTSQTRWGILAVMLGAPPVAWLPRPPTLAANREVFAVTIQDSSLSPRFDPGERVYCDPTRPPSVGAYAVAITHDRNDDGAHRAIAGRVDAITATSVTIGQLQPATSIDVPTSNIATLARILTTAELLGT